MLLCSHNFEYSPNNTTMAIINTAAAGIFLGKVGVGKTTVFNKICDETRSTLTDDYASATRTYARHKIFYGGDELVIFDGPGCKSKEDTYKHSYVIRHGLTHEPLNGIFVFVEYNSRIGSIMADDFWEVAKLIKPQYLHLVVLVVTKMDQFQPDESLRSRDEVVQRISRIFEKDHDIHRFVFSDKSISKESLFTQMHDAVRHNSPTRLEYSDAEFLQYFELNAWKGREMADLYRTKNCAQGVASRFIEGLKYLEEHRHRYSSDEWQEFIFGAIQQSHKELEEEVMNPFVARNVNSQIEFDDYAAWIEVRKIVSSAHDEVRAQAKRLLPINPDDTDNWRNALRKCQYCGEVWVKVSGCDGETTCGLIPEEGDPYGNDSFINYMWATINGKWRPHKKSSRKTVAARSPRYTDYDDEEDIKVGCGRTIDWKNQAILSLPEVEALFNTQDLEQILSSFGRNTDFLSKKQQKENDIVVFSKIGANGKVIDP